MDGDDPAWQYAMSSPGGVTEPQHVGHHDDVWTWWLGRAQFHVGELRCGRPLLLFAVGQWTAFWLVVVRQQASDSELTSPDSGPVSRRRDTRQWRANV